MAGKFRLIRTDLGYEDLRTVTSPSGWRVYHTPDGNSYPSITSLLSARAEKIAALEQWRRRVGEEQAEKTRVHSMRRGTEFHLAAEAYLRGSQMLAQAGAEVREMFASVRPVLDRRVDNIRALESALYSDRLRVAGRVDCVAEHEGELAILDFKTSARFKRREWMADAFVQEAAYAEMWEERTGLPVTLLVTCLAVAGGKPQIFVERKRRWLPCLCRLLKEHEQRDGAGRRSCG